MAVLLLPSAMLSFMWLGPSPTPLGHYYVPKLVAQCGQLAAIVFLALSWGLSRHFQARAGAALWAGIVAFAVLFALGFAYGWRY